MPSPTLLILSLTVSFVIACAWFSDLKPLRIGLSSTYILAFLCGLLLPRVIFKSIQLVKGKDAKDESIIYGLDHGRLHLKIPPPMWMNMGFWRHRYYEEDEGKPISLACACSNLLNEVLKTAGFNRKKQSSEMQRGVRRSKTLIDLGFGCGDQTIYLVSDSAVTESDKEWWHCQSADVRFDHYVGITKDEKQFQYASERVQEFLKRGVPYRSRFPQNPSVKLHCADAANPNIWSEELKADISTAMNSNDECWVLALDTIYHFSPSRWHVINHISRTLNASFMAFDLCLSPSATLRERLILRILTTLMGAPWANFVTIDEYREKLIETGYSDSDITIKDISSDVFAPLAKYLEEQDRRLKVVGYGLGSFRVAQWMFAWWGRSGVVIGVIVVAKKREEKSKS